MLPLFFNNNQLQYFKTLFLDIETQIPNSIKVINVLLPPYDIIGNGSPVLGNKEVATQILITTCNAICINIPVAKIVSYIDVALIAIFII